MQQAQDIVELYQKFGGAPETFQEITRAQAAEQALRRWSLIAAVEELLTAPMSIPSVRTPEGNRLQRDNVVKAEPGTAEAISWAAPQSVQQSVQQSVSLSTKKSEEIASAIQEQPMLDASLFEEKSALSSTSVEDLGAASAVSLESSPLTHWASSTMLPKQASTALQPDPLQQLFAHLQGERTQPCK